MATSPDGGGLILFGGVNLDKGTNGELEDIIIELRFGADKWTRLPKKLNQPRYGHVVIPIPYSRVSNKQGKYLISKQLV